ncbi:cytochrome-c peroxidase [Spirochaetota bacterium]
MRDYGIKITIFIILACILFQGCKKKKPEEKDKLPQVDVEYLPSKALGLPAIPVPKNNPQTPEKIALGEKLYKDTRFSADKKVSCATCHDPQKAFVDSLPVSRGFKNKKGTRNAPTVINAVFYREQFWDGRRLTLEEQSKDPFLNKVEHALSDHKQIIEIIRSDKQYVDEFKKVFDVDANSITIDHVAKAIASFERTIIGGDTPFDKYRYGGDKKAISKAAIRGLKVFNSNGRCQECHTIGETDALFIDNKYHNLGVGIIKYLPKLREIVAAYLKPDKEKTPADKKLLTDKVISELGRFVVTKKQEDIGAFKTPTLRNIALTGPYLHDGSHKTLKEVILLYKRGGEKNPFLSGAIRELKLSNRDISDLIAFLKALTSPKFKK